MIAAGVIGAGCDQPSESAPSAWAVANAPRLTIESMGDSIQLSRVDGVRRLAGGAIVVANSGANQILRFDSSGRFQSAAGRRGSGPGDFQGTIRLLASGDTTLAYDAGLLRWSVIAPNGSIVGTVPAERTPARPVWLYRGAIVTSTTVTAVPRWIIAVLDRVRAADPSFTQLIESRIDEVGSLWLREPASGNEWSVFVDSATAGSRVALPARFEWFGAGSDFVVGVARDSLDVERIDVLTLDRGSATPLGAVPAPIRFASADDAVSSRLIGAIPFIMMAQEGHYAKTGSYTRAVDSLQHRAPSGARAFLFAGDARQWAAVVIDIATGVTCGVSVGQPTPAGWTDGTPFCGR